METAVSQEIIQRIKELPVPKIIAVSGFGGSGKTTYAELLGEVLMAPVVGVDSFQQEDMFDSEYRLWEVMDFLRLEKEVLEPFTNGATTITYHHYDSTYDNASEEKTFTHKGTLVVEGVGLLRPELLKYFSLSIWLDCPLDVATARGKKRDREVHKNPHDEEWDGIWYQNELQCLEAFRPGEVADIIVQTG